MNTIGFTNYAQPVKSEAPWQENYSQDTTFFGKNVFLPINLIIILHKMIIHQSLGRVVQGRHILLLSRMCCRGMLIM